MTRRYSQLEPTYPFCLFRLRASRKTLRSPSPGLACRQIENLVLVDIVDRVENSGWTDTQNRSCVWEEGFWRIRCQWIEQVIGTKNGWLACKSEMIKKIKKRQYYRIHGSHINFDSYWTENNWSNFPSWSLNIPFQPESEGSISVSASALSSTACCTIAATKFPYTFILRFVSSAVEVNTAVLSARWL